MKKLMIMAGLALSVLSVSALGGSGPVRAAGFHPADATASHLPMGEDGDDDGDDEDSWESSGGGSGAGSGAGSLPATGSDATSIALLGALALAAGGAMYGLSLRRQQQR